MHVDLGIILFASTSNSLNSLQACSMIIAAGTWTMQETSRPESRHLAIICWWPELRPKPRHESSNWLEFLSPHISSHQFIPDRRPRFSGYLRISPRPLCRQVDAPSLPRGCVDICTWLASPCWMTSLVGFTWCWEPSKIRGRRVHGACVEKCSCPHALYIFTYIYRCIFIYIYYVTIYIIMYIYII